MTSVVSLCSLWALKRVYGGRRIITVLRGLGVAIVYSGIVGLGAAGSSV